MGLCAAEWWSLPADEPGSSQGSSQGRGAESAVITSRTSCLHWGAVLSVPGVTVRSAVGSAECAKTGTSSKQALHTGTGQEQAQARSKPADSRPNRWARTWWRRRSRCWCPGRPGGLQGDSAASVRDPGLWVHAEQSASRHAGAALQCSRHGTGRTGQVLEGALAGDDGLLHSTGRSGYASCTIPVWSLA